MCPGSLLEICLVGFLDTLIYYVDVLAVVSCIMIYVD